MTRRFRSLTSVTVIMADTEGESLESWLNKATNPSNRQEEWEYIIGFCDQINKELEGPQISVRLLAHKIQSPQDWESLQSLTVLEACMKNCGRRFHNEVGKFRFLNELIKVVSPKYLADRVSEQVKTKVIELLYSWSVALPNEAKITEAYQMLKKQGIVTADPEVPVDKTLVPSPKPKNPVFDNEEKSKRLAELLKSKKPEDLQEANRIIKSMVKEDEAIQQKASQRTSTLEEVKNSVKLLNEMLNNFKKDESTQADKELMKDLYNDCDKLRTAVFKLATETEDDDSALGDILHASDDLSRVINSYKNIVEGQTIVIDTPGSTATERLGNLDTTSNKSAENNTKEDQSNLWISSQTSQPVIDLLYGSAPLNPLISTGPPTSKASAVTVTESSLPTAELTALPSILQNCKDLAMLDLVKTNSQSSYSSLGSRELGQGEGNIHTALTTFSLPAGKAPVPSAVTSAKPQSFTSDSPLFRSLSPTIPINQTPSASSGDISLTSVFVPLEAIKPSKECPVTAYDKDGVRVLLHFATDHPPGRPDVLVIVVSMLNTAPLLVRSVVLQAAVPKSMRVKLQPPSGTDLTPYNPLMPPSSITQIMLLANPLKEKVRMRYQLTFILGDRQVTETGEIDKFPPVERWGHL
ncbi:ADP-ribosylation factor-binding protein GGA3-like isoform X2 [Myxocyprinus asiaticus]|uniref:ADP-ribosylation factor-binding protein GGA3-like isoform X2 n=1 Tax=Myxocyprinus asiaticus TaxID=70543 RepID=UPI002223488E|nr:ADP-ribosylation factor-binding protein GGA3-like isoform X2 [Myxocyprinus asiaticus]